MKILQVAHSFYPCFSAGGVVRCSYEISKSLVKRGHDVTVYTTDGCKERLDVKTNKPVNKDGINIYYFRNLSNKLRMKYKFATPPHLPFVVRKEIKDFDIIHIHEHRTLLAAIVSHYARKYDVPYVVQPRGSAQKMSKSLQKTIFDYLVGYKVLREAEKIILSSQNEYELSKSILKKAGIKKEEISYIPNGININESTVDEKNFRDKYDIKNEEKIILYLGRITKVKGLDLLIKAFEKIVTNRKKNFKLVIIGPEGNYSDQIKILIEKSKAKDRILLPGPLYGKEKYSAYSAADVFVLPSKEIESFGNVVLEAASCGTNCVVTDVCGVTDWMDNLIKVTPSVGDVKKGIGMALGNEKIGKKARDEVFKKFDWNTIVENNLISIYEKIII